MRDLPGLKGFLLVLFLASWAFAVPFSFFLLGTNGWFALYAWLAVNLALAFWLNQSRTHSGKNTLDDRLPTKRVVKAQEHYIDGVLENRAKHDDN